MKLAFVFSGQGSQYTGMGQELYQQYSLFRETFEEAEDILHLPLSRICFDQDDRINDTEFTQPAMLTMSWGCFRILKQAGFLPDCLAGLSLGEYSALTVSGALSFSDAVGLVHQRGRWMKEAVPPFEGGMSAVLGMEGSVVADVLRQMDEKVFPANYNMPGQTVIAGMQRELEKAEKLLLEKGAKRVLRLKVSGPFHTPFMQPAAEKLQGLLAELQLSAMDIPVYTNLTGRMISPEENIRDILVRQVMSPVLWEDCIRHMQETGVSRYVELGPGKTLLGFIKKVDRSAGMAHVEDQKSLEQTLALLETQS